MSRIVLSCRTARFRKALILDKQAVIKRNARLIGPEAYPIVIAKNVVI